jgi:hypothetical protein
LAPPVAAIIVISDRSADKNAGDLLPHSCFEKP